MTTEADKAAKLVQALGVTGNLLSRLTMLGVGDAIATCSNARSELSRLSAEVDRLRADINRYAYERDKAREERDHAEARSEAFWKPRLEAAEAQLAALSPSAPTQVR